MTTKADSRQLTAEKIFVPFVLFVVSFFALFLNFDLSFCILLFDFCIISGSAALGKDQSRNNIVKEKYEYRRRYNSFRG
jgi:hypothetical protein